LQRRRARFLIYSSNDCNFRISGRFAQHCWNYYPPFARISRFAQRPPNYFCANHARDYGIQSDLIAIACRFALLVNYYFSFLMIKLISVALPDQWCTGPCVRLH